MTRSILIALTSHRELGDTGRETGFFVGEAAHPWKVFTDAGYTVDLASVAGGVPPQDGLDADDPIQQEFLADERVAAQLAATPGLADVDPADYDAVFLAGGHGTMWDFPDDTGLAAIARAVYEGGGVVSAVCHGPSGLVNLTLSDGTTLVEGKRVSAFTNEEEAAVGLTDVVPFLLQTRLEERGAKHSGAANFVVHVVRDGRLVTGQNPASATGVAEAVLEALSEARRS